MILIAGVDEAGRGPLAGPVIAAAVILNPNYFIEGLRDSKQLSGKQREKLALVIREKALAYALGRADAYEIDEINILQASLLAMRRAIENLLSLPTKILPSKILIDGQYCPKFSYPTPFSQEAIIKGDQKIREISAASILAKTARDAEMHEWDAKYPQYGFAIHKGYPTKAHRLAITQFGLCPLHRKSFRSVTSQKVRAK